MAQKDNPDSPDMVRTTETMLNIIEYLKQNDGGTITEIASELGYAKSTVHRHLSTLSELGYVINTDGKFSVGLKFLEFGQQARKRHEGYELIREKVREIADQTEERAQFIVEEHGQAVYLSRSHGEHAIRTDPGIGSRIPLHATAAGKALFANLPETRCDEIIEQTEFEPVTEHTIIDRRELLDELETIRERGYSFNRQENLEGLHAVGVAVAGDGDEIIGALSVSGPTHRFKGDWFETELPDLLLGAANELELNIAHS